MAFNPNQPYQVLGGSEGPAVYEQGGLYYERDGTLVSAPNENRPEPVMAIKNLNGGITFSAGGLSAPYYPSYRAPKSPYVFGNAAIIDRMMADTELWNVWCFGDSRTGGIIEQKFMVLAPVGIPLGGITLVSNQNTPSAGFTAAKVSYSAGDSLPASPLVGYISDNIIMLEARTVGSSVTANLNTTSNRLSYSATSWNFTQVQALLPRLVERRARARVLVRRTSEAWSSALTKPLAGTPTMPNLYLQVRQSGSTSKTDPGYFISPPLPIYSPDMVEYSVSGVSFPAGFNWAMYNNPDIGVVCDDGCTVAIGSKLTSFSLPWVELPTGIIMREIGCVAGRSIAALVSEEITPTTNFSKAMLACGGKHALWMAIGSNNPANQTVEQFLTSLQTVIEKFRVAQPNAPVICTTNYANSIDSGEPYYVTALKILAASDPNVVVLDTYNTLPNYAAGVAAGYYADTVHYNASGQAAYAAAYWSLWIAA